MSIEYITLSLFTACNALRIFAYIPQLRKAATDANGASAVSCTTWGLFLLGHLSTVAYAVVNLSDRGLAVLFGMNAFCCLAILVMTVANRLSHKRRLLARMQAARQPYTRQFWVDRPVPFEPNGTDGKEAHLLTRDAAKSESSVSYPKPLPRIR